MSIYATHWILKFPSQGDEYPGCDWVEVIGQGVPAHIGTPSAGYGYEAGDPYADFLPPPIPVPEDDDGTALRAMVIVRRGAEKVGQEYVHPILSLSGPEYASMSFDMLYRKICAALRGKRPSCIAQVIGSDGRIRLVFEDGTSRELPADGDGDSSE
jgi:hypothetical protein